MARKLARKSETSGWCSFTIFIFNYVLNLLAFVTPWWKDSGGDSRGLWMRCLKPLVYWKCTMHDFSRLDDKMVVTVAMMVVAFALYNVMLVMYIVCIRNPSKDIRMTSYVGFAATFPSLIGLVMFGAVIYYEAPGLLAWSYIMATVSCVLVFVNSLATYFIYG